MNLSHCIHCESFPCQDVRHEAFTVPSLEIDPQTISVVLISEAAAVDPRNGYYGGEKALFAQTTLLAFNDAGIHVTSIDESLQLGIYMTTAIKCAKTEYKVSSSTIRSCSYLLEQELALFPSVKAYLLMGDVAIQAANTISIRQSGKRAIPAGSTYKIRTGVYTFNSGRAFPSYLQAGPSFFIEKSKRKMIAQDIAAAIRL